MPRLFSYTVRVDDGAAPNPFSGMCTLAICKPAIRRAAEIGDWIVGLGSVNAPSGNLSGHLVYAMKVEEVMTLEDYDRQANSRWPHRIPDTNSLALQDRLGDCIYDYSSGLSTPLQRSGVHGSGNVDTDLGGMKVLYSRDFYYFGRNARKLPSHLLGICHQTQGHRSTSNEPYFNPFVDWIRNQNFPVGQLLGWPDSIPDWNNIAACGGCVIRKEDDEHDHEVVAERGNC